MYYCNDGRKSNRIIFARIFKMVIGENKGKWSINFYNQENGDSIIRIDAGIFPTKYAALHFIDRFSRKSGKTISTITILN